MTSRFLNRRSPQNFGHVLITGSSRGIGRALAETLVDSAERLTLCSRNQADLDSVAKLLGASHAKVQTLAADLSSFQAGADFGAEVLSRFGSVDTLILNSGTAYDRCFAVAKPTEIENEIGVNYLAPLGLTQSLLPTLRQRPNPRLVVISSLTAVVPFPSHANYAASKAALSAWVRSISLEAGNEKISTLVVLPGLTDTRLAKQKSFLLAPMKPERVAEEVKLALSTDQKILIPGTLNRVAHGWSLYAPDKLDSFIANFGKWFVPGMERHAT